MTENMKNFLKKVSADKALAEKASKLDKEGLLALAKELGVALTEADFVQPEGEASEAELAAVSGGKTGGCACVMAGGGGGKNNCDDTYGCACVLYGQGGDGSADDFTCYCALGGEGVIDFLPDEII